MEHSILYCDYPVGADSAPRYRPITNLECDIVSVENSVWNVDTSHSSVDFSVRHMGLATVRGSFGEFDLKVEADPAGVPTKVRADIAAASIETGSADRDAHLRSADFFDVENHPTITFESTDIAKNGDELAIAGILTIRGMTHPVSFTADFTGPVTDPWGNPRIAADAEGKINRTKWGLTWNQVLEAGSLLVGEDVKFQISAQAVKPQTTEAVPA